MGKQLWFLTEQIEQHLFLLHSVNICTRDCTSTAERKCTLNYLWDFVSQFVPVLVSHVNAIVPLLPSHKGNVYHVSRCYGNKGHKPSNQMRQALLVLWKTSIIITVRIICTLFFGFYFFHNFVESESSGGSYSCGSHSTSNNLSAKSRKTNESDLEESYILCRDVFDSATVGKVCKSIKPLISRLPKDYSTCGPIVQQ